MRMMEKTQVSLSLLLLFLFAATATGLAPGRSRVVMTTTSTTTTRCRVVVERALSSTAKVDKMEAWLGDWWSSYEVSQGVTMPLRGRFAAPSSSKSKKSKVLQLRFVAVPSDGVDCWIEKPGVDSPYGLFVAREVLSQRNSQAVALAKEALSRFAATVEGDAEAAGFFPRPGEHDDYVEEPPPLDSMLYRGDYGEGLKDDAVNIFEEAAVRLDDANLPAELEGRLSPPTKEMDREDDERIRKMFERGAEMALALVEKEEKTETPEDVAAEAEADGDKTTKNPGQAQFDVSLRGTGLKGGIDIFAGPPPEAAEEEGIIAETRQARVLRESQSRPTSRTRSLETGEGEGQPQVIVSVPSAEMSYRFQILLRELVNQPDSAVRDLVLDAYRDVLLDPSFPALARDAMARTEVEDVDEDTKRKRREEVGAALEDMNEKVIDLATQLAELAAFAEQQHLETIRLVCEAAKGDSTDRPLDLALRELRPRFDDDFIAYLVYAVNDEAHYSSVAAGNGLKKGGENQKKKKEQPSSEWRLVLNAVKDIVYSYLAKERVADLDVIYNVLNLKDRDVRRKALELQVERMSDERLGPFLLTARNIFDNLLFASEEETTVQRPNDPAFHQRLHDLRADLLDAVDTFHAPHFLRILTGEDEPTTALDPNRPRLPANEIVKAGDLLSDNGADDDDDPSSLGLGLGQRRKEHQEDVRDRLPSFEQV